MTREEAISWLQLDIDMIKFDPNTGKEAYLTDYARNVMHAEEMAIDALAERQDGAWKKDGYYLKCSCCSFKVEADDLQQINFCPNCGAKMT